MLAILLDKNCVRGFAPQEASRKEFVYYNYYFLLLLFITLEGSFWHTYGWGAYLFLQK